MMEKTDPSWPEWLGPLCEEIARELDRLDRSQDVHRPALEREAADLQARLDGWVISLANPNLSPCVRQDIEEQYARTKARLQTLRSDLSGLEARQARHRGLVDPRHVLDRLQRLGDVLASGNVARGNLELCRHIDRIDAYADGRVVMRTSKLGIFEGAATVLARPAVIHAVHDGRRTPGGEADPAAASRPRTRRPATRLRAEPAAGDGDDRGSGSICRPGPEVVLGRRARDRWADVLGGRTCGGGGRAARGGLDDGPARRALRPLGTDDPPRAQDRRRAWADHATGGEGWNQAGCRPTGPTGVERCGGPPPDSEILEILPGGHRPTATDRHPRGGGGVSLMTAKPCIARIGSSSPGRKGISRLVGYMTISPSRRGETTFPGAASVRLV